MKRKTNVPITGDSPGGSARRHVLRALAFLLVLLFTSPQAKAYFFTDDNLEKLISFDGSNLDNKRGPNELASSGYIEIKLPFFKKSSSYPEGLYSRSGQTSTLKINGKPFLYLDAFGLSPSNQNGDYSIINVYEDSAVVAKVRCHNYTQYESGGGGTAYKDISTNSSDPTTIGSKWQDYSSETCGFLTLRVWPKMSDLLNGSITIEADLFYRCKDGTNIYYVNFKHSEAFTFGHQFTSTPELNWGPSSDPGKFDFTFTPFNKDEYYYIDNEDRTTTSSTNKVTRQYDISNSVRDVTLTYGCTAESKELNEDFTLTKIIQDFSYSTTISIPAYLLPTSFTATQQDDGNVLLAWEVPYYNGNQYKDDRWVVERADNPDFANPTEVCRKYFTEGATSYTYTDQVNDLNLNGTYYYRIRRTAVDKWGWASALTKTAEVDLVMNHIHVTNASATMDESGSKAVITWDWNGNVWLNNSKVTIVRTNESRSTTATFTPSAQEFADRKFVDLLPTTCDVYSYKMYVTPGSSYYRTQDELTVAEPNGRLFVAVMGDFESIEASKGYYGDCIMLDWTTDDKPIESFSITARVHGSDTPYKQIGQLTASTGLTNYTYTYDKCVAGVLYDFQVLAISHCGNDAVTMKSDEIIGFSRPTGTVNGRITYGSGQNVKDVTVKAVPEENSFTKNKAYSFPGDDNSYLEIEDGELLKEENVTIQAWVNTKMESRENGIIVQKPNNGTLMMFGGNPYFSWGGDYIKASTSIIDKEFANITAVATPDSLLLYVDGEKVEGGKRTGTFPSYTGGKVLIGKGFTGEIDEVRLWSRALTAQEIANNYNAYLVGNEQGLEAYYTFDFGVDNEFYDLSYYGTEYNKRD